MEIRRIRQFRTVVEARGLIKAAKLLQLTPGTLSKSIRELEAETGGALFARVGRSLELNERGRRFYAASDRLIEEHARLLAQLDAPHEAPGLLRIASFEVFTTHVLGELIGRDAALELRVLGAPVGEIGRLVSTRE